MSSVLIPKEKLSAYQRWELAALDAGNTEGNGGEGSTAPLPTVEQIHKLRENAQIEGHAAGFELGRLAGLAEGKRQSSILAEQLAHLAQAFRSELSRADEVMASELLELALDLAKAMLKVGLEVRAELVIPVVREAIQYLPAVQPPATVSLHPEDALLVKDCLHEELAQAGWCVAEDPTIERGGCRIETATNQIDASIGVRWQRLAGSLGKLSDWLT
jgi:flagellar assembly protein FliH